MSVAVRQPMSVAEFLAWEEGQELRWEFDGFQQVPPRSTVITDPVVVFEVLSESTSRTDRIEKLREYAATPSIQRYVILEQDAIAATVYTRKGADMVVETLAEADTLRMPEIDVEVPMAEFYSGVELIEASTAQAE
jgi:hypothetical protein